MSCHFHMLRRRRAAEAAKKLAEASQSVPAPDVNKHTPESVKAAQKPSTAAKRAKRKDDVQ